MQHAQPAALPLSVPGCRIPTSVFFTQRFLGKGTRQAAEDKTSSFRFFGQKNKASHLDGKLLLPPTEPSSHSHGEALMQTITERSAAAKSS